MLFPTVTDLERPESLYWHPLGKVLSKGQHVCSPTHSIVFAQTDLQIKKKRTSESTILCVFSNFFVLQYQPCFLDTAKFFFSLFSIPSLTKKVFFFFMGLLN